MWKRLQSQEKVLEKKALTLLHLCPKILAYRKDKIGETVTTQIVNNYNALEQSYQAWEKDKSHTRELELRIEALHNQLKTHGNGLYPLNFWNENAEILWVAALLAIGIRTFFFQPFRIPTNSMFPSFSGMQTQIHSDTQAAPNFFYKPLRWLFKGAENYRVTAPCEGRVVIPLFEYKEALRYNSHVKYSIEYGREIGSLWIPFLFPKPYRVYTFYIHNQASKLRVPFEFNDMEAVIRKKFFPKFNALGDALQKPFLSYSNQLGLILKTQHFVKQGQCLLHFDILAGDMLFVDRISYHFRQPRVGEAIVFKTNKIPMLGKDQYYIKRLAGRPRDVLEIDAPKLLRNGQEIAGSSAFQGNNRRIGLYPGYQASGNLQKGQTIAVPKNFFYALGDNSPYSYDSRYWGFVPQTSVIGKASFVLHPFTWRWGVAEKRKANEQADPNDYIFQ